MREILFRGKRTDNGEWIEGYLNQHRGGVIFDCCCNAISANDYYINDWVAKLDTDLYGCVYKVIPETVGQFTGLTDKNGVKIFEGDIVRYDVNYHDMVISYDVENWDGWLYEDMDDNMQAYSIYEFNLKDIAVIGNIHDNPEILKGGGDND